MSAWVLRLEAFSPHLLADPNYMSSFRFQKQKQGGRFAPLSENMLITSLGKQRPVGFVNEKNSASWPILVITSIQIFIFFFPNSSRIFKETQKLFSWQEPNLYKQNDKHSALGP